MLYLLRHAQSDPSADVEEPAWPLSEVGRGQARALVPVLTACGVDVIYSSPYRRAMQTVAPFAWASGYPIRTHTDLRERRLTHRFIDDVETQARRTWDDFSWSMSDGETNAAAQQRFVARVRTLVAGHPDETVLVSAHGTVIALFLNAIDAGVDVETWSRLRMPELIRVSGDVRAQGAGDATWTRLPLPGGA